MKASTLGLVAAFVMALYGAAFSNPQEPISPENKPELKNISRSRNQTRQYRCRSAKALFRYVFLGGGAHAQRACLETALDAGVFAGGQRFRFDGGMRGRGFGRLRDR